MTEPRTILVVDDDASLRAGLSAALGRQGYRTLEADDGMEARQMIDRHRPDLVILDMMMPHWGGLAVLEHFRGHPSAPRFIMITANEGAKHKDYAEKLGVLDYIRKPFSLERLIEGVVKVIPPAVAATAASIRCRCSGCGSRIKAPLTMLGQTRPCPGCKRPLVIAIQPPEDEGPRLVMDDGMPTPSPSRF